jgi:hypothetical protein
LDKKWTEACSATSSRATCSRSLVVMINKDFQWNRASWRQTVCVCYWRKVCVFLLNLSFSQVFARWVIRRQMLSWKTKWREKEKVSTWMHRLERDLCPWLGHY